MTPLPPDPFPEVNRAQLPAGSVLHRVHHRDFEATSFNPGRGRPTRFAPMVRSDGSFVPTAYAAGNFECAVHETVFHEVQHNAARKTVPLKDIEQLAYGRVTTTRALTLATLHEPDLNAWGQTRADLIDTFASQYPRTVLWALAIHDQWGDIDGLAWTSKRCDPHQAFVLFGERLKDGDLDLIDDRLIAADNSLLMQVRDYGRRAGITLVS